MKMSVMLFKEEWGPDRMQAQAYFSARGITLNFDDKTEEWPLSKCKCEIGGASSHLLYVRKKENVQDCFYFQPDDEFFQFASQRLTTEWMMAINKMRSSKYLRFALYTVCLLTFIGLSAICL